MSRRMAAILGVAAAVVVGGLAVFAAVGLRPKPAIRFVECRKNDNGVEAIFQITNRSLVPYTFACYDLPPPSPPNTGLPMALGARGMLTASGWRHIPISPCWGVFHMETLAPRHAMEVRVRLGSEMPSAPVSLGIRFYRGTAAQVSSPGYQRYLEWKYRVRHYLKLPPEDFTWSTE